MSDILAKLAVFLVLYLVVIRPITAAYMATRPPRLRVTFRTPADWGAPYEDISLTSQDGTTLAGWYVPSRNGAAVILLHGHSGNRLGVAYHAEALIHEGYGVLLYDLRAHGDSGGRRFSLGEHSIQDALAAVAYVAHRPDVVTGRIGIMGVSIGGMLALHAASRTVALRAVAADAPAPATMEDLPSSTGIFDRFWRYPLEAYYRRAIGWFSGEPEPRANLAIASKIAPRPVLLIATGTGFERRMVAHLCAAIHEPRRLWTVPEASHAAAWHFAPEAYAQEMVRFFDGALSVNDPRDQLPLSESHHD